MPQDLVADEKITWLAGEEVVSRPRWAAAVCWASVWRADPRVPALQAAYGEFETEATAVFPEYAALRLHGRVEATRDAWRQLFPHLTWCSVSCTRSSNSPSAVAGPLRAPGPGSGLGRLSRRDQSPVRPTLAPLAEWARTSLEGRWRRRWPRWPGTADFTPAYDCPQAARTTNAVDRVHNSGSRLVRHAVLSRPPSRAHAWPCARGRCSGTFIPMAPACARIPALRSSPFADLNGFHYHPNWLHNFLIASSMGGLRL